MPGRAGFAPRPMARLPVKTLLKIDHETPMLLSAAPLLHTPPVNVLPDDVHRPAAVLRQRPHGAAAEIRTRRVAAVADEPRADDLEPSAAREDRTAPAAVDGRAGGVAVGEGQVLHDQTRRGLVLAVRRGPGLLLVAGVLVEDAALPAAAEGDQAAAVEDDATAGVDHLGGRLQLDPDRVGPAAEPDDPALGDRPHHRARRAAPRRAAADPRSGWEVSTARASRGTRTAAAVASAVRPAVTATARATPTVGIERRNRPAGVPLTGTGRPGCRRWRCACRSRGGLLGAG